MSVAFGFDESHLIELGPRVCYSLYLENGVTDALRSFFAIEQRGTLARMLRHGYTRAVVAFEGVSLLSVVPIREGGA